MSALLFLAGFVAGIVSAVVLTQKIDRPALPAVPVVSNEERFDAQLDAIEQWNQALLNVPAVRRQMNFKETRQ